jgi:hypothetical protein
MIFTTLNNFLTQQKTITQSIYIFRTKNLRLKIIIPSLLSFLNIFILNWSESQLFLLIKWRFFSISFLHLTYLRFIE